MRGQVVSGRRVFRNSRPPLPRPACPPPDRGASPGGRGCVNRPSTPPPVRPKGDRSILLLRGRLRGHGMPARISQTRTCPWRQQRVWPVQSSYFTFLGSDGQSPSGPRPHGSPAPPPRHPHPRHLEETFSSPLHANSAAPPSAANRPLPSNKVPAVERVALGVRKVMS